VTIIGATKISELTRAWCFMAFPRSRPQNRRRENSAAGAFRQHGRLVTPALVDGFEKAMKPPASRSSCSAMTRACLRQRAAQSVHDRAAAELAWAGRRSFSKNIWGEGVQPVLRLMSSTTACARQQVIVAVRDLHRRPQSGRRGAHPHLARNFAVTGRQPDALVPHRLGRPFNSNGCHVFGSISRPPHPHSTMNDDGVFA